MSVVCCNLCWLIKAATSSAMAMYVCSGECGDSPWFRRSYISSRKDQPHGSLSGERRFIR